jgi:hypothetical protein
MINDRQHGPSCPTTLQKKKTLQTEREELHPKTSLGAGSMNNGVSDLWLPLTFSCQIE